MADGTTLPISEVQVGDLVAARDPLTGLLTAQPVLNVIVGHGDKHLIKVVTGPAPASAPDGHQVGDDDPRADSWTGTANHPIWVEDQGWTDADDLVLGEPLMGASSDFRVVQDIEDQGRLAGQTVYSLSVANVHTFIVGDTGDGTLVHNTSRQCWTADGKPSIKPKKQNLPGPHSKTKAEAEARARADAAVGGNCSYRGVFAKGGHVHVDYHSKGRTFSTTHYTFGKPKRKNRSLGSVADMLPRINDPVLKDQIGDHLPPRSIAVDNTVVTLSREIDGRTAVNFVSRGRPAVLVSFKFCSWLTAEQFKELWVKYGADFEDATSSSAGEARMFVYGSRKGSDDRRLIVAMITWLDGPP